MSSPMYRVNELVSSTIGDTLTNIQTWNGVMYNVLQNGLVGDGVTDDTVALQTLINTAIAAGRKAIFFPHTATGGEYYVTALTNADQVVFFGDNASFVGGYTGTINQIGDPQSTDAVTAVNAVAGYDADPTGLTDTTTELQAAATAAIGKTLFLPPGDYLISSTITIPADTTVFAHGARIFNTTTHITMLSLSNNAKVYGLELQGAGNASAVSIGIGISMIGIDSSNYKDNAIIEDCYIHDVGFYGIDLEYTKNVTISKTRIFHVGYTGIMGISVTNVNVDRCHVKDISPGTTQCYGIAFTRLALTNSLVTYPRSKDCTVSNSLIEDNILYEGLDTHAGENIKFIGNTIRNCPRGISITASQLGGVIDHSSKECKVIGNTVYGLGTGFGIQVIGDSTLGAPTVYNEGTIIEGNTLFQCGLQGSSSSGGIYAYGSRGMTIQGNVLHNCYAMAININHDNQGFTITGNTIIDPQDNALTYAGGVVVLSNFNTGTISGNTFLRVNAALNTFVGVRGIYIASSTSVLIQIGINYNNFTTPHSIVAASVVVFGNLGGNGVGIFAGAGLPEGVITAPPGSLYLNQSGGASTTLYVKQSLSGNTGWVAK